LLLWIGLDWVVTGVHDGQQGLAWLLPVIQQNNQQRAFLSHARYIF